MSEDLRLLQGPLPFVPHQRGSECNDSDCPEEAQNCQYCDHVANFLARPASIHSLQDAEQYILQALKTRALMLKEFDTVKIAGLTIELLYGIFSLLSHKSGVLTVESLRDYFRKFGDYHVSTQTFLNLVHYVRMRTSSTLEPKGDVLDFLDVTFLLAEDVSGIYEKVRNASSGARDVLDHSLVLLSPKTHERCMASHILRPKMYKARPVPVKICGQVCVAFIKYMKTIEQLHEYRWRASKLPPLFVRQIVREQYFECRRGQRRELKIMTADLLRQGLSRDLINHIRRDCSIWEPGFGRVGFSPEKFYRFVMGLY